MIKILTVIGARPQIIKSAAISRVIKNDFSEMIQEKVLHTGQHYDKNMSEVFFQELGISTPDFNLHVGSASHTEQISKMLTGIVQVLESESFDALLVYGDTNSTLAGALAASRMKVPVIHVEAGLRSYNMAMPEEQNRVLCDQLSSLLFAPTQTAMVNMEKENIFPSKVKMPNGDERKAFNLGDVMYDNSLFFAKLAEQRTTIISDLELTSDNYVLATIHRDINADNQERLSVIFEALLRISEMMKVVIPLHPRTAKHLPVFLKEKIKYQKNLLLIPPVPFLEMMALEKNARMVMTDSGGVQKEAYFFNKPCVIFRDETEWLEIIEQGAGILTGADRDKILTAYTYLSAKKVSFKALFGDGKAAQYIVETIVAELQGKV